MRSSSFTAVSIIFIGATLTSGLTACANRPGERYAGNVVTSEEGAVARCRYLGSVSGTSGLVGFFGPKGVDNIKQDLLKQADSLGATHLVYAPSNVGYMSTTLAGRAYQCPTTAGK